MVAAETYISQFSCVLLAAIVMDNIGISLSGWLQDVKRIISLPLSAKKGKPCSGSVVEILI
jgi:hypothetical protein